MQNLFSSSLFYSLIRILRSKFRLYNHIHNYKLMSIIISSSFLMPWSKTYSTSHDAITHITTRLLTKFNYVVEVACISCSKSAIKAKPLTYRITGEGYWVGLGLTLNWIHDMDTALNCAFSQDWGFTPSYSVCHKIFHVKI